MTCAPHVIELVAGVSFFIGALMQRGDQYDWSIRVATTVGALLWVVSTAMLVRQCSMGV